MKFKEQHLAVLLKAASAARPGLGPLPCGQARRIIAQWRSARAAEESIDWRRIFRIGLAFACICLLLTAAFSLRDANQEPASEFAMPSLVINLAFK